MHFDKVRVLASRIALAHPRGTRASHKARCRIVRVLKLQLRSSAKQSPSTGVDPVMETVETD